MYAKLALRNIKRSVKDYTIYFLTLIFGVCIFYAFNAMNSQQVMMELNDAQKSAFEMISIVMTIASVFISFILGFLIIYASNYLIKRRKKEFGVYITLGMEKGTLSKLVFIETIIIGIVSLISGLVIGVFLSQGLSIVTANLFKVDIVKFKFIFSKEAFIKTVICFGIIYLVVLIFNSLVINKVKLIDLLNAAKKNEKVKIRSHWVAVIVFIISIVLIGSAYYLVLKNGVAIIGPITVIIAAMGAVGTFLFFFSLSGFLLKIAQGNKRFYLKDLNMFVLKQINSKINTTFISMTFISLMLFISICALSGGLGLTKALNNDVEDLSQFDASFWSYSGQDIKKELINNGVDIDSIAKEYASYNLYDNNYKYHDFLSEEAIKENQSLYPIFTNSNILVMKLTEFNSVMKMLGQDEVKLEKNQYLICSDILDLNKYLQENIDSKKEIKVNGEILKPADGKIINVTLADQLIKNNLCTFIVNDEVIDDLSPINSYLNITYKDEGGIEKYIVEDVNEMIAHNENLDITFITKEVVLANSAGTGAAVSYLAIYMGCIFLITSAAVLALQQLSESADNMERYKLLRKIGVDNEMINKSIFTQIAIYFMVPLSVAIIHSIVGLKISSDVVSIFGSGSMMKYVLIAIVFLIIVYGGYFLATYFGAKKIINE